MNLLPNQAWAAEKIQEPLTLDRVFFCGLLVLIRMASYEHNTRLVDLATKVALRDQGVKLPQTFTAHFFFCQPYQHLIDLNK